MIPGYCSQCKKDLNVSEFSSDNLAWCPKCNGYVVPSWFEMKGWVMGVVWLVICVAFLPPF